MARNKTGREIGWISIDMGLVRGTLWIVDTYPSGLVNETALATVNLGK